MDIVRVASNRFLNRTALVQNSQTVTYNSILKLADVIRKQVPSKTSTAEYGPRIGIFAEPGPEYVASTYATWLAGGIAVPLATSHPSREIAYVLQDAGISTILVPESGLDNVKDAAQQEGVRLHVVGNSEVDAALQGSQASPPSAHSPVEEALEASRVQQQDGALIIYTSGTTGKPKGVLHTHKSVMAQVNGLSSAWSWESSDRILHSLPLHHVHGIVNALYCAHANGATVEILSKFSPSRVWQRIISGEITVFMGVPTMYNYLVTSYQGMDPEKQHQAAEAAKKLRLTISGSAACPVPLMEQWIDITGKPLLERYGMTEIGMALSNPYEGERRPGFVGLPLPGVQVRLAPTPGEESTADSPTQATPVAESATATGSITSPPSNSNPPFSNSPSPSPSTPGQLLVKGDTIFKEYWGRPEATREAFDPEGWFYTGDTACLEGEPPYYKIMGRTSVDIIKSRGYKISALHIENMILEHPHVAEVAVLGLPHPTLGQEVAAVLVLRDGMELGAEGLRTFCKERLPPYQLPQTCLFVGAIPRNAMGKVNKKQLAKELFPSVQ